MLGQVSEEPAAGIWWGYNRKFNGREASRQSLLDKEWNKRKSRDPTRNPRTPTLVQRGGRNPKQRMRKVSRKPGSR